MASIRLEKIVKRYDNGLAAVREASLNVSDGEFVVLVGPSGCGKSTTLRMIAGLEEVTEGNIFIGDQCVNDVPPGKRDVAMVFQNYALYPHMTVRENMSFGLRMHKTPKPAIRERVNEAAKILSIQSLMDRRPGQLSGGQRQRVAVGRAIVRKPAAFLFDEPLSNLDARLRVQMRKELAELHRQLKTTTIYVTHDQIEAMTLGQRIVVMNEGEIQQVATPIELYEHPANRFVASFMGNPAMNLVTGRIINSEGKTIFRNESIRFPVNAAVDDSLESGEVILGFRPEHLSLSLEHPKLADVTVGQVEQLGDEVLVYFETDGHACVARLASDTACHRGDQITLHLPADQWHLFSGKPPFPVLDQRA